MISSFFLMITIKEAHSLMLGSITPSSQFLSSLPLDTLEVYGTHFDALAVLPQFSLISYQTTGRATVVSAAPSTGYLLREIYLFLLSMNVHLPPLRDQLQLPIYR